jgi:hypothetical protein
VKPRRSIGVCKAREPPLGFHTEPYVSDLCRSDVVLAMMKRTPLATGHLDVALTIVGEGRSVLYRGPHQGVFRFESVKIAALRRFRASSRVASVLGGSREEEAALRKFLAGV